MYQKIITLILLSVNIIYTMTVDSVIVLSDSCVQTRWVPDSVNTDASWYKQYGGSCSGADSIYLHCDFIAGREYRGIPYSYGGEDSWYVFREHLSAGYLAGSHQCQYNSYGDPSDKVTGTDCSGFLCFVWGFPRSNTSTFYNSSSFTEIPLLSVKPGDALVKATANCGYHAILIVEADTPSEVVISEASSTVSGCRERIVDLTNDTWKCYKAIRNPDVLNVSERSVKKSNHIALSADAVYSNKKILLSFKDRFDGIISVFNLDGSRIYSGKTCLQTNKMAIPAEFIKSGIVIVRINSFSINECHKITVN